MANGFSLTGTVAQGMLNGTGLATAIGASGKVNVYSGTVPGNADAANGGTLLATLTLAATPFSGFSDTGTAGRATLGVIASALSAAATGTASFFRITTSGGTVIAQGTVGTSAADLVLNSIAITAGSTVAITSGTIDLPKGP
jgi:hypothetical protein